MNQELSKSEYMTRIRQLMLKPKAFNKTHKDEIAEAVFKVSQTNPEIVLNIDSLVTSDTFHEDISPHKAKPKKEESSGWHGGFTMSAK